MTITLMVYSIKSSRGPTKIYLVLTVRSFIHHPSTQFFSVRSGIPIIVLGVLIGRTSEYRQR